MKRKTKRTVYGITCILGFLFMVGSFGSMDFNTISLEQGVLQCVIGLVIFAVAGKLGGFIR
jgi:hypothetical protein